MIKASDHEKVLLTHRNIGFSFLTTTTRLVNNLVLAASRVSSKKRATLNKLKCALQGQQRILKSFIRHPAAWNFKKNKYGTTTDIFELL